MLLPGFLGIIFIKTVHWSWICSISETYRGLRGLRPGEIELFVEAAIDYNDKCRALEWLRQSAVSSAARLHITPISSKQKKIGSL